VPINLTLKCDTKGVTNYYLDEIDLTYTKLMPLVGWLGWVEILF